MSGRGRMAGLELVLLARICERVGVVAVSTKLVRLVVKCPAFLIWSIRCGDVVLPRRRRLTYPSNIHVAWVVSLAEQSQDAIGHAVVSNTWNNYHKVPAQVIER